MVTEGLKQRSSAWIKGLSVFKQVDENVEEKGQRAELCLVQHEQKCREWLILLVTEGRFTIEEVQSGFWPYRECNINKYIFFFF